jgi:hypothetical protein
MKLCHHLLGERNEHTEQPNARANSERMMTILIELKYPPNRRIFLHPLSPVQGTVDLTSCYSHEEASVLYWTLL